MRLAYGSFTYACGVAGFTDPDRIVGYAIISGAFHPLNTAPHLRPLPSAGITPLQRYYGPLRHPTGLAWLKELPVGACHTTERASRVATSLVFHACQRQYPGEPVSVPVSLASRAAAVFPISPEGRHSH